MSGDTAITFLNAGIRLTAVLLCLTREQGQAACRDPTAQHLLTAWTRLNYETTHPTQCYSEPCSSRLLKQGTL